MNTTSLTKLTKTQMAILSLAIVPMIAVGVLGGIGSYSNISHAYGSGTALGALAAGEGATAVLAMILLGLTLLGQSSPLVIRMGLWLLPATASVMGATAAHQGLGQTIVYAATPLAITAGAEGLAFLVRRIVVHQAGRDAEAEARAAAVIRDLAYHQARAASHPNERARKRSVRLSWRLARKVGQGDVRLGTELLDIQRTRLTAGADMALERMFTPGMNANAFELPSAPADTTKALPSGSTDDAAAARRRDVTIQPETSGYPQTDGGEQGGQVVNIRRDIPTQTDTTETRQPSLSAAVRERATQGVTDIGFLAHSLAATYGRKADDPTFRATIQRYVRDVKSQQTDDDAPAGVVYM